MVKEEGVDHDSVWQAASAMRQAESDMLQHVENEVKSIMDEARRQVAVLKEAIHESTAPPLSE